MHKKKKGDPRESAVFLRTFPGAINKGDRRKSEILETAVNCFALEGVESTSFQVIGAKLGIGRAHSSYYFKTKSALIEEVMRFCISTGQELTINQIKKATNPQEKVLAVLDGAIDWCDQYPAHAICHVLLFHVAAYDKKFKKLYTQIRHTGTKRMVSLLEEYFADKNLSRATLVVLAHQIQGMITANILAYFTMEELLPSSEAPGARFDCSLAGVSQMARDGILALLASVKE